MYQFLSAKRPSRRGSLHARVSSQWKSIIAAIILAAAVTGAAVLRATRRIYLGLGPDPGDQAEAPSEKADRPLALRLAPVLVLLSPDPLPVQWIEDVARSAARLFAGRAVDLSRYLSSTAMVAVLVLSAMNAFAAKSPTESSSHESLAQH